MPVPTSVMTRYVGSIDVSYGNPPSKAWKGAARETIRLTSSLPITASRWTTTDWVAASIKLSAQGCPSVFTFLAFHVVLKLLAPATIHCGLELIDQSFRGIDDVFGARERAAFDIVDIVQEPFD